MNLAFSFLPPSGLGVQWIAGGRWASFLCKVKMKVERKDIYDFVLTLDETEFSSIKTVSDYDNTPIEDILADVIQYGFDVLDKGEKEKE